MSVALACPSAPAACDEARSYVTAEVAGQLVGIPIERVRDVFVLGRTTPVPLAPPEIVGLVNLRGRVLTAIDLRVRLGLSDEGRPERRMALGIDGEGEHLGLVVDAVGDVLRLAAADLAGVPSHLGGTWAELSAGIHRLQGRLLAILDLDAVLDLDRTADRTPSPPSRSQP